MATTRATELGQLAKLVTVDSNGNSVITGTFDATLPASGVVAGVHGSASSVPIMSVTAQGLIDSVGSAPINTATSLSFDSATGQLTLGFSDTSTISQTLTLDPFTTDNLTEGSNLYYTDARFDSAFGVKTTADLSEGSNLYYTDVRFDSAFGDKSTTNLTEGDNLYYTQGRFDSALGDKTTDNLTEGSNLYYTTARADSDAKAAISVTDAGGDGSLTYSAGTITYTGPSASEVRAHFSGGTGVDIASGVVSIGQNVDSSSNVIFQTVETTGNVTIGGNLQVNGATTTVSSQNLSIEDNMLYLNQLESDGSPTIEVDVGFAANVNDTGSYAHTGFFRDATDATWKLFDGYTPEPDSDLDIDINHASFSYADLQVADLTAGNITVSGTVDGRDVAADGTKLDGIESGATADQSASEILTAIKTVDGASSGLDADQLDGLEASQFLRNDTNGTSTGSVAFGNVVLDPDSYSTSSGGFGNIQDGGGWAARGLFITGGTGKAAAMASGSGNVYLGTQDGSNAGSMATWLQVAQSTKVADFKANPTVNANAIWHAGNDGSGSGLDADTVDGLQGSSFVQKSGDTLTGTLNYRMLQSQTTSNLDTAGDNSGYSVFYSTTSATSKPSGTDHAVATWSYSNAWQTQVAMDWRTKQMYFRTQENNGWKSWATMWHSDNDGSGSGLDADTVDGVQLSGLVQRDFQDTNRNLNIATNSTGSAGLFMKASDGGFRFQIYGDGTDYGFLDGDWAAWDLKKTTNGALYFNDNNSYYLNPPGTSRISTLETLGNVIIGGIASNNHFNSVSTTRLSFGGGNDMANYHIGTNMENYGGNYTKLDLRWHTGIRMGAQQIYGGIRFYDSEDLGTVLFSIGKGGTNTRVESGNFYSNIMYDRDDTAYYADPHNYSRFKSVQAGNQGALNANTTYAMGLYHNSRYMLGFRYSGADSNYPWLVHDTWNGAALIVHFNGIGDRLYLSEGGLLESTSEMRSGSFVDRSNTAYYFNGDNTGDSIRVAGDIVAYYSDERLKDKEGNISGAIDKVSKLNGFYYRANKKAQELGYDTRLQVGVSAQEVEAVLPEVVKDAPIGQGYKTVKYDRMVPLLIEAIKEQQEIINKQSQDIDELKQLVKQLMENK